MKIYMLINVNGYTLILFNHFQREQLMKFIIGIHVGTFPAERGLLLEERICSKFFLLRVDPSEKCGKT